ncbi:MAG: hypothetical protein JW944_02060 [Deltaproteobacteria bacterium]|nr:hypothetical protein [Deltaproteobacteria bacterium]
MVVQQQVALLVVLKVKLQVDKVRLQVLDRVQLKVWAKAVRLLQELKPGRQAGKLLLVDKLVARADKPCLMNGQQRRINLQTLALFE